MHVVWWHFVGAVAINATAPWFFRRLWYLLQEMLVFTEIYEHSAAQRFSGSVVAVLFGGRLATAIAHQLTALGSPHSIGASPVLFTFFGFIKHGNWYR